MFDPLLRHWSMLQSGSAGGSNSPATLLFHQCLSRVRTGNIARASLSRLISANSQIFHYQRKYSWCKIPLSRIVRGESVPYGSGPSRVHLNESPSRIVQKYSVLFFPILSSSASILLSLFLCLSVPHANRDYMIFRGRFVIIRRIDMADRFWRLALCWICIVGLAAANGERFKPNTFKANHVIVVIPWSSWFYSK